MTYLKEMINARQEERRESSGIGRLPVLEETSLRIRQRPFIPPLLMGNGHVMTILGKLRPRSPEILRSGDYPGERREFQTEPDTRVVAYCHWQKDRLSSPTMLIVHGLEGSAEASYVLGIATKALAAGFNVLRYNVRNCGGTSHLTPKLYHSGLTVDLHHVVRELIEHDRLERIYLVGVSMGGNQSLKMVGEMADSAPPQLRGVCAISPPISLELCSAALMRPENIIYETAFLRSLRRSILVKNHFFPGIYDISRLDNIRHLWEWDDVYQPYNGFRDARDYYAKASSIGFISGIKVPTLIIHALDDPFIPAAPFREPALAANPNVLLVETSKGGHVAFCGVRQPDEDRAWAENRAVEFCVLVDGD